MMFCCHNKYRINLEYKRPRKIQIIWIEQCLCFLILINQQAELETDEPMYKVSAISGFSYLCMKIKSVKEDSANWLDLNLNSCIG